jgi:hypothetical protein
MGRGRGLNRTPGPHPLSDERSPWAFRVLTGEAVMSSWEDTSGPSPGPPTAPPRGGRGLVSLWNGAAYAVWHRPCHWNAGYHHTKE